MQGARPVDDDPLLVAPFSERLERFLESLRGEIGARALVLVEVDSRGRVLAPRVRVALGSEATDAALSAELVALLARAEIAPSPALGELGAPFVELGARVVELDVEPRFWSGRDAWLVTAGGRASAASAAARLERGLSVDRRERLARTVFRAIETATDPFELTDGTVRAFYVNRAWERLTGYARGEVIGKTLSFLRDPDAPKHDPSFYRFIEDYDFIGRGWISMLASRRKDGAPIVAEIAVGVFDAPDERMHGNAGVRRDVTPRAAREDALAAAHLEFHRVISALPQPIAVFREGRVYFANSPLFALLGLDYDRVIGARLEDLVHPDDREAARAAGDDARASLRFVRPGGAVRAAEMTSAGTISFEGKAARIALFRDLTEERFAAARAAHADRLAALGALAASIAHEINNPLTFVLSNLEATREAGISSSASSALDDAIDGARRIRDIIVDLRSFVRPEDAPEPRDVDVARAMSTAKKLVANELRHLARVDEQHEPGLHVRAQDGPLVQVLVNLLVNAAQAMARAPGREHRLTLRSRANGDAVEISVGDTGDGISEAGRAHLFEPFATRVGSGMGIGLSLCRRIVESFGGSIRAESTPGAGTTMIVSLPRGVKRAIETPAPTRPPPPTRRSRILVVDDEPAVGRAIKRLLTGHEVEVIDASEQALDRLLARPAPDVVLCDLMMPGITGPALYARAIAAQPEIAEAFVFLTGGAFTEESQAFLASMSTRVLMKPFRSEEVRRAVDEVLARRASSSVTPRT